MSIPDTSSSGTPSAGTASYFGVSATDQARRRAALRNKIIADHLDALLVTDLINIRYLTGFTGSNAALLIAATRDDADLLVTDSRYEIQAGEEAPDLPLKIERACDIAAAVHAGTEYAATGQVAALRLGFEEHLMTVARHQSVATALADVGTAAVPGAKLTAAGGLVETLREVKDASEIAALRRASEITDAALAEFIAAGGLRAGRTEREAALDLDERMRRLGADEIAFPTILAAGENSAIPHHQPTDRPLKAGDLVKIDFGAMWHGYHADMTRVFVLGAPADWQRDLHTLVATAQQTGRDALLPGVTISDVDSAARDIIAAAGHGQHFGHGLGHGVGLEIHEAPWFAPKSHGIIKADMTVTVEPGVYLSGQGGVRIEDSGVVGPDGYEPLTLSPRDLVQI
ncbi:MAG: Xaa-Pro peptidase family protein [Nakamurella sp.]